LNKGIQLKEAGEKDLIVRIFVNFMQFVGQNRRADSDCQDGADA